jgi:hypothetical protein
LSALQLHHGVSPLASRPNSVTHGCLQEWEVSKVKQDKALNNIERGLGTLEELATAMGENLDHQDVLIDAVGERVRAVCPFAVQGHGQHA